MDPQPSIQGVITNSLESENRPVNLSSNNSSLEGGHHHLSPLSSIIHQNSSFIGSENASNLSHLRSPPHVAIVHGTTRPRLPLKKAYRKHNSLQEVEHSYEAGSASSTACPIPHPRAPHSHHHHHHSLQRQASFDLEPTECSASSGLPSASNPVYHGSAQSSIPSLSSMEVKARLKECVLTRRRTQGLQVARSLSSQTSSFESTEGTGSTDSALRLPIRPVTCGSNFPSVSVGIQETNSSPRLNVHAQSQRFGGELCTAGVTSSSNLVSQVSRKRSRCGETLKLARQSSHHPYIKVDMSNVCHTGTGDNALVNASNCEAPPLSSSIGNHLLRKTSSEPNLITPAGSQQQLQLLSLSLGYPQHPVLVETSQEISSTTNEESQPEGETNVPTLFFVHPRKEWTVRQSSLIEDAPPCHPEFVVNSQCMNVGTRLSSSSLHSRAQQWRYRRQQMRQCYSDEHQHHGNSQLQYLTTATTLASQHSNYSKQPEQQQSHQHQQIFLSHPWSGGDMLCQNNLLANLTHFVPFSTGGPLTPHSSSHKSSTSVSSLLTQHQQLLSSTPLNILLNQPSVDPSNLQSSSSLLPNTCILPNEDSLLRSVSYSPISSDESVSCHAPSHESSDVHWDIWSMKHTQVVNMGTKTGLACDPGMLAHRCLCDQWNEPSVHPECPARLISICKRLQSSDLLSKCVLYSAPPISLDVVRLIHGPRHPTILQGTLLLADSIYESTSLQNSPFAHSYTSSCPISLSCPTSPNQGVPLANEMNMENVDLHRQSSICLRQWWQQHHKHLASCGGLGVDSDTYWHPEGTLPATLLATGQIVSLMNKVWRGDLANGFALIRPPGHHAESEQALGYCYVNHLAVACATLLQGYSSTMLALIQSPCLSDAALIDKPSRILLVDWDVHHGNGTQVAFQYNAEVLYISLHRHEEGSFFPGTGSIMDVGQGNGSGCTINIAWSPPSSELLCEGKTGLGDAEYLAAFRTIVLPVAKAFRPQLVAVSAGFDAAEGHSDSLGGYRVSPACFAWMTRQLHDVAEEGRLVLSLEGGYNLDSLATCVHACAEALVISASKLSQSKNSHSYPDGDQHFNFSSWQISEEELHRVPCVSAQNTLLSVMETHAEHWPCLRSEYLQSDVRQSMAQSESNKQLTHLFACLHVHNR